MVNNELGKLLLSPATAKLATSYLSQPGPALLITGSAGSGKYTLARVISACLLGVSSDSLVTKPNFSLAEPGKDQTEISIDTVRRIRKQLSLKNADPSSPRVVLIEQAHKMSPEAQNAILKILEEPPPDAFFLLTAPSPRSLLPTIASRAWVLAVHSVSLPAANRYYGSEFNPQTIEKAWNLGAGTPGLLHALLKNEADHPLKRAVDRAKQFISATTYERLIMVDSEASSREGLELFLEALSKILRALHQQAALRNGANQVSLLKGRKLLKQLAAKLDQRANPRLIGLELALNL